MIHADYTGEFMDNRDLLKHIRLFRNKANTHKLITFVGAGVSRNVTGMPDLNALIQKMADAINYSRCDTAKRRVKAARIRVNSKIHFLPMSTKKFLSMSTTETGNFIIKYCAIILNLIWQLMHLCPMPY